MSYCVNCGVELDVGEKLCPLCGTEVINPRAPWSETSTRPYPPAVDSILHRVDRRYAASLLSASLLLAVAVTVLCDLLTTRRISWSIYVLASGAVLAVWVILPLYARKYRRMLFLSLDCAATLMFFLAIFLANGADWAIAVAVPISASLSVLLLTLAYLFRNGRGRKFLARLGLILLAIGILALAVEISFDLHLRSCVFLGWSPYVLTTCVILAVTTQIIQHRKNFMLEIEKRLFY
ncbi:MAG: hypothetical protein RR314_03355 [Oscillospiraceae bacterium]